MSITTTQFLAIADNVTKSLLDMETALQTNFTNNAPTKATVQNGQTAASNSLLARIGVLSAADQGGFAGRSSYGVATSVSSYVSILSAALYKMYAPLLIGLDRDLGGVYSFLWNNSLQIHPEFAACFNWVAANASYLGNYDPTIDVIPPSEVFPASAVVLGTINVTGAAAGTFVAGSSANLALYSAQQLYIVNNTKVATPVAAPTLAAATPATANATGLAAGVYTVGYTFITAAGETALSPTATVTLTAGQAINVSSIALPTGATGIKFYASIAAGNVTTGFCGVQLTSAAAVELASYGQSTLSAPASNGALIASTGTATSLTITYTKVDGTSGTVTQALGGALTAGASLAAGSAVGSAVAGVTVNSSGSNNDSFTIQIVPLRTVAY